MSDDIAADQESEFTPSESVLPPKWWRFIEDEPLPPPTPSPPPLMALLPPILPAPPPPPVSIKRAVLLNLLVALVFGVSVGVGVVLASPHVLLGLLVVTVPLLVVSLLGWTIVTRRRER